MESSSIAGTAVLMSQASNSNGVSLMMIKQAADSEKQLANMVASAAGQQPDPQFNLSVYA